MKTPLPEDRIAPSGAASLGNLENLAGLVEDLHSCAQGNTDLDALVLERFGPGVSVSQVRSAFEDLRAISLGLSETTPS